MHELVFYFYACILVDFRVNKFKILCCLSPFLRSSVKVPTYPRTASLRAYWWHGKKPPSMPTDLFIYLYVV
jgi:hypothetical protein